MYCTVSKILNSAEKFPFASHMVQVLNMILFTASELYELRMQLKDLAKPVQKGGGGVGGGVGGGGKPIWRGVGGSGLDLQNLESKGLKCEFLLTKGTSPWHVND